MAVETYLKIVTELLDMKIRYEESDNMIVRASRAVTDKLSDFYSKLFCYDFYCNWVDKAGSDRGERQKKQCLYLR